MTVQDDLRNNYVVAVNEYPSGRFNVGHMNATFFDHGVDQGTYGFNIQGRDIKGRPHGAGLIWDSRKHQPQMLGGVFKEPHANAMTHYVIVSKANYFSMQTFALSQAQITAQKPQVYGLLTNNCSDFLYKIFLHTDLPEQYRNISTYLKNKHEPVAIYTGEVAELYTNRAEHEKRPDRNTEHAIVVVRLLNDAVIYLKNFPVFSSPNP